MKTSTVQRKLRNIAKDYTRTDLVRNVAESIIDQLEGYENPQTFFEDLAQHGCVSGMIGELIYYKDTYTFFDENYSDIMDLVAELNDEGLEIDLAKDGDIKNTGAWLAYEETARQLSNELGMEV